MNPHALSGTSSLSWRVCQFRHSDVAPDRPGSVVNLPARPLLPARRRHLGSRQPWRIHVQASTLATGRRPLKSQIGQGPLGGSIKALWPRGRTKIVSIEAIQLV